MLPEFIRQTPFGVCVTLESTEQLTWLSDHLEEICLSVGLIVARGLCPLSREQLLDFSSGTDRDLLHWEFGPVMEMTPDDTAKNYLFTREAVPFHWDGAFLKEPGILVFNCVDAPTLNSGGETLFCHTELVWNSLNTAEQNLLRHVSVTYETKKLAHYGGSVTVPIVSEHPLTGRTVLRYAEPVSSEKNPVTQKIHGKEGDEIRRLLKDLIYNPRNCYSHQWQSGDLIIADNRTLIHGRNQFSSEALRHFRRVQIL